MSEELQRDIYKFLSSLKIHNRDLDVCFDDAVANTNLKQLITRYGNSRELEGRIDERKRVALDNYEGKTFAPNTDWSAKYDKFVKNNYDRFTFLEAQRDRTS